MDCLYKVLTDLGSLIGGLLALLAGWIAYRGALKAANRQVEAAAKKDRLQADSIVVAISPELPLIRAVLHGRVWKILREEFPKIMSERDPVARFGELAPDDLQIPIPPLLNRNTDHLYLLDETGRSLLNLVSLMLQYNDAVDRLARHIREGIVRLDPADHVKALSGYLEMIDEHLCEAEEKIRAIYDRVMAPPEQSTPVDSRTSLRNWW
jgi:hypothetical protein